MSLSLSLSPIIIDTGLSSTKVGKNVLLNVPFSGSITLSLLIFSSLYPTPSIPWRFPKLKSGFVLTLFSKYDVDEWAPALLPILILLSGWRFPGIILSLSV